MFETNEAKNLFIILAFFIEWLTTFDIKSYNNSWRKFIKINIFVACLRNTKSCEEFYHFVNLSM